MRGKSKHSLKLYNPTPEQSKVLLLNTSVFHTHTPAPSLSKKCERFCRVPCRGERKDAATSWWGGGRGEEEGPNKLTLTENIQGQDSELRTFCCHHHKNQAIQNESDELRKAKCDQQQTIILQVQRGEKECNWDSHF